MARDARHRGPKPLPQSTSPLSLVSLVSRTTHYALCTNRWASPATQTIHTPNLPYRFSTIIPRYYRLEIRPEPPLLYHCTARISCSKQRAAQSSVPLTGNRAGYSTRRPTLPHITAKPYQVQTKQSYITPITLLALPLASTLPHAVIASLRRTKCLPSTSAPSLSMLRTSDRTPT